MKCTVCNAPGLRRTRCRKSDGTWEDVNGVEHPRYYEYTCDHCGTVRVLDLNGNLWVQFSARIAEDEGRLRKHGERGEINGGATEKGGTHG